MWRAAGLEEPNAKGPGAALISATAEEVGDAEPGAFTYYWAARKRGRDREFPPARPERKAEPGEAESESPGGANTDGDEA